MGKTTVREQGRDNSLFVREETVLAGMVDRIPSVLYDRVTLKAGEIPPPGMLLFSTPMGMACPYTGRVKSLVETNMVLASVLPAPHSFLVARVGFLLAATETPCTVPDASWSFEIDQKWFARGPLALDAGIGSLRLKQGWLGHVNPEDPIGAGAEVNPECGENLRDVTYRYIAPLQSFCVRLNFASFRRGFLPGPHRCTRLAQDLDFWCVLAGVEDRPIQ